MVIENKYSIYKSQNALISEIKINKVQTMIEPIYAHQGSTPWLLLD
jgi:hypothetical protein